MNTTKGIFSHATDEWETPQDFFDELNRIYHFDLDVCATEQNAKCDRFFNSEQDGLKNSWGGVTIWCNPPYSNIIEWCRKATEEQQNGTTTVMLVPARTDTKWFHQYVWQKPDVSIQFVRGRLRFGGSNQNAPFPSMVIVFRGKTDGTERDSN